MNDLSILVKTQKLNEICHKYQPSEVVNQFSFKECMILSFQFLMNNESDETLREYGVRLIEENHQIHLNEWAKDWRNEIFLGDAYYLVMNFDEQYEAYKRGAKSISPLPPALLVSLAGCYLSPSSHLTIDEAEKLVLEALEKEKTIEGATLIRGIYKTKNNLEKFLYWDKVLQELESRDAYMKNKWPEFLNI